MERKGEMRAAAFSVLLYAAAFFVLLHAAACMAEVAAVPQPSRAASRTTMRPAGHAA
jgi:hypothetical protein